MALTVPLLVLLAAGNPAGGVAVRIWVVLMGALGAWAAAGLALRGWVEVPVRPAFRRRGRSPKARPEATLKRTEHAVTFAFATSFDLHFRLRPRLVRVAAHRLRRRGLDLAADPERCRAALGPEAWELVRPDRPAPADRAAPGISQASLARVLDALDAV